MKRRTLLTGAASALALTAGCAGDAPETPDDGPANTESPTPTDDAETESPTATPAPPSIVSRSLEPREECGEAGSATITTDGAAVVVEGCIVGKNGCMVPSLESAAYDAAADELAVGVVTADSSGEDEACTQQIVHRGYAVTVEFDGGLPGTTTVTHDGMEGEREVARAETNG